MIKHLFIPVLFIFSFGPSHAQFDTIFAKTNIRHCADSMTTALKTRNWEQYARYVHPAMIGSMNGKAEFIRYMTENYAQIPVTAFKQYEPGKILQVIKTAGDLQAVIELKSIFEWEGQRIASTTSMIAQSWDGGLFWTFFVSDGDREIAKLIKPDISDDLIIPKKKESIEPINPPPKKNN